MVSPGTSPFSPRIAAGTSREAGGSVVAKPASRPSAATLNGTADHPTFTAGMTVGRYTLTEMVGRGASGIVYRAVHQSLGMAVALKVLRQEGTDVDPQMYEQLRAEARLLAQLNHPNIVRVLDYDDNRGMPYLVMEFVEGRTLDELIRQSGHLRADRALTIARQSAEGLAAAWRAGIIHRDIKPANILLDREGNAKIADLGQARFVRNDIAHKAGDGGGGTPAYMAPEQFDNQRGIDFRADIYSLGATFYHALTGQMPFTGRSAREVMFKHITQAPSDPQSLIAEIPTAVSAMVLRMMAKKPEARFSTPEEFLAALADLNRQHTLGDPAKSTGLALERPNLERIPDAQSLYRQGVEAAKAGNKSRAMSLLRAATELAPGHEESWLWLATTCDDPRQAVAAFSRALAINPANSHAAARLKTSRLHAAYAELKANDKVAARHYLLEVIDSDPRHEQAWMGLAVVATDNAEVCHALEQVLEINPNNEKARRSLNEYRAAAPAVEIRCPMCQSLHPQPLPACPVCRAVLSLEDPEAALRGQADPLLLARALDHYEKAVARRPDFANLLYLSLAHLNGGSLELGLPPLEAAAKLRPDDLQLADRIRHLRQRLSASQTINSSSGPAETLAALDNRPTVLVVDDSATIRKVLTMSLSKSGYRVIEAADGTEGLKMAQTMNPGMLLLDVNLPGMDGYAVCRALRSNPKTKKMAIVMISGQTGFVDRIRARMAGCTRFIGKPCKAGDVLEAVQQLCAV